MTAGADLKAWRDELDLSQSQAADLLEISQSTYCDYENNKKMAATDVALRIQQRTGGRVPVSSWAREKRHGAHGESRSKSRKRAGRAGPRAG